MAVKAAPPRSKAPPPAPPKPAPDANLVPIEQAARLLEISTERIRQLQRSGHIDKASRGMVSLVSAVRGYVKFLKEAAAAQSKSAADSRVRDARAKEIEHRLAVANRELVSRDDATAAMDILVGIVRDELRGLPARTTREMALRRKLENQANGSLTRIAEALAKLSGFVVTGGELPYAGSDDDA